MMGKRRKVRKERRVVTETSSAGWRPRWGVTTGTELCEVPGCDGACGLWHVL